MEDKKVYEIFKKGNTDGIFQFETPMMKRLIQDIFPDDFETLVSAVALGRPGPKDQAIEYIKRKKSKVASYPDERLKSILEPTYGVIIYQEQIMAILRKCAGYTYAEADLIRRAISKKNEKYIKEKQDEFVKRAKANGYDNALDIYLQIEKFASFGFNKSHSVSYALISYQMAYLKTYYPGEFLITMLSDKVSDEKIDGYINYFKARGKVIIKPDINKSHNDYYLNDKFLVLPLYLIKGITREVADKIIQRRNDIYNDVFEFCAINRDFVDEKILQVLIKAGALDSLGVNRRTLDENALASLNYGQIAGNSKLVGKPLIKEYPEYEASEIYQGEKNSFGVFLSNHPASNYKNGVVKLANYQNYSFKNIKLVVLIEKINVIKTKKNEKMAFILASDETGKETLVLFPSEYQKYQGLEFNRLVMVNASVTKRFDKYSIIVKMLKKVG